MVILIGIFTFSTLYKLYLEHIFYICMQLSIELAANLFNNSYISVIENMAKKSNKTEIISNIFFRYLLISAGTIFTVFGIVGIFLPILPTTPFLLLAVACFARSSQRFYNWLMNNRWFGNYIKNYHEGRGVPLKVKIFSIFLLWLTILISIFFIINNSLIELILLLIAIGVSIHVITIKTYTHKN